MLLDTEYLPTEAKYISGLALETLFISETSILLHII